ncbi:hypothetical protein D9615_008892 [Tricholomella constricta]|uniref:Telomere-associated protein Rif1 N-terminal domain-containing protein n=1 Tax=Tricholomella constricta TaxID=117010 RepID=A0A8H5GZZ6_9AGAR|nr:hypothetical protein D9615_008892 [Tricholomella constricta]
MKIPVLSNSIKGNLIEDSIVTTCTARTTNLKRSMDMRPTKQTSHHEPTAPVMKAFAVTTENDPMMCPSYLSSPLETILESLDDHDHEYISFHDIIEAYTVLSTRIRAYYRVISRGDQPLPALGPLKEHAASLARALRRDIRCALVDASSHSRRTPPLYESYQTDLPMSDHDIQIARNLSAVCHHGLRVLSDVFAFKALYSLFPIQDLKDLVSDLLKVALTSTLPTPSASKTWSLIFWTIQAQNLPLDILSTRKEGLVTALRLGLNGEKGLQAKRDSFKVIFTCPSIVQVADDLSKAIHTLLKSQPELFASLSGFLPTILANLVSEDADCRLQAAHSLSGLALAKLQLLISPQFPHETISKDIHAFIRAQTSPIEASQGELRLPGLFRHAFSCSTPKEPLWAIVITTGMIVLSDHFLFLRHSLKFCVNSLRPALTHKCVEVQALHAPVWRMLIWTFSRLPMDRTWFQSEDPDIPDNKLGVRGKAFRILRQELRTGKGVSLVGALLRPGSGKDTDAAGVGNVSRALLIVKALVAGEGISNLRDGIMLLHRLVSAIGKPESEAGREDDNSDYTIETASGLFDGTLLDAAPDRVKDAVRTLAEVKIDRVRQLSEEELIQHWNGLVEAWIDAMEKSLQGFPRFSRELLDIWQALLLAQAHLTQEHAHLTAPSSFAGQIAGIVNRFIIQTAEADIQVQRITSVKKLWGVMKNVYSPSWLPAESILAAIIKVKFSMDVESVRSAWSQLCADLISVGVPSLLHIIFTRSEKQEEKEVTRQLWAVLARAWQAPDETTHWEELVSFLTIPFKAWVMSEIEFELWEATLRSAVSLAGSTNIVPTVVAIRFFQRMGEKELNALESLPKEVATLLTYVDLSGSSVLPVRLLNIVDRTLTSNYPPQPEKLAACLEILRLLGIIISSVPATLLVQLLCATEKSLYCWMGDEKETMLGSEHDIIVKNLYCDTLSLLRDLPQSLETLIAISPFLSSAFGRLTSSAAGPLAFNEFWRATYHGVEDYRTSYPDCLKACLLGLTDAFGGSIADGLSVNGQSQLTGMSTVPDSQPSHHDRGDPLFFGLSFEGFSSSPIRDRSLTPTPMRREPSTKRRRLDQPTAFQQLEGYSSFQGDDTSTGKAPGLGHASLLRPLSRRSSASRSVVLNQDLAAESPFGLSTPRLTPREAVPTEQPISSGRKRSSISERQIQKRRKTDTHAELAAVQGMPRRHSDGQLPSSSPLRPTSPMEAFSSPPSESFSQDTETRKRKRVINWVSISMNEKNSIPRGEESRSQLVRSGPSTPKHLKARPSTPSSAEYDSWEAGVSKDEFMQFQRELDGSDNLVPDTDLGELDEMGESEPNSDLEGSTNLLDQGPSRSACHRQQRSQTAPSAIPQRNHERPTPLRRHQTTSARIDALERAYSVVANDASQIPVADLVHATGLVTRIQSALNEQLTRRLAKPGSGS